MRTSNRLIVAIKPQRQRALLNLLFPAAMHQHPCFFFPFIHRSVSLHIYRLFFHSLFLSASPACLSLYFSSSSPFDVALTVGPHRGLTTLCLLRPVGSAPVKHASLLWHFNYISSTHSTSWAHNRWKRL